MKQSIIIAILLLVATNITQAADASAGKTKSLVCSACHGADGNSSNDIWPSLAGQSEKYLSKQMVDFRDGKRKDIQMSPMAANLSDNDIADISAYFASQEMKASATKEEFIALGSKIYTGGVDGVLACTACHGPSGNGLDAAGFPRLAGQKISYNVKQLNDFKSGTRVSDANSMMNDIAAAMSEEQIAAVANYLAGLH